MSAPDDLNGLSPAALQAIETYDAQIEQAREAIVALTAMRSGVVLMDRLAQRMRGAGPDDPDPLPVVRSDQLTGGYL